MLRQADHSCPHRAAASGLDEARRLLEQRRFDEAEAVCRRLLLDPDVSAEALSLLALAVSGGGNHEVGYAFATQAASRAPDSVQAHLARGVTLRRMTRFGDAIPALRRARDLAPASLTVRHLLVQSLIDDKQPAAAECEARAALEIDGRDVPMRWLLIVAEGMLGRFDAARAVYRKLVAEDVRHRSWLTSAAYGKYSRGDAATAEVLLRLQLALDRWQRDAVELLRIVTRGGTPPRAPAAWVREVFDGCAPFFQAYLTGTLRYRSHEQLGHAIGRVLGTPSRSLAIVDLGCGTGLCGPLLRPYAARLVGVDISPEMLTRARALAAYDVLVESEIGRYLKKSRGRFDIITATDVFIYFGDLHPIFRTVARRLRAGGWFAFTVERHDGDGFVLHKAGRYAHSIAYIRTVAAHAGMRLDTAEPADARIEAGIPVKSWLVLLRPDHPSRTGDPSSARPDASRRAPWGQARVRPHDQTSR
jgi:predicted TPR repeat methyltransferase